MPQDTTSQQDSPRPRARTLIPPRWHAALVPLLLAIAATLAIASLAGDSPTFDEPLHLASGVAMLKQADFRMSADHPPLARVWCALPLLFMDHQWPDLRSDAWVEADIVRFSLQWMFELNDPQRLIFPARLMMVAMLLGVGAATYATGRRLFGPDAGLLALLLAAFSPTLLAHGRLVTTDLSVALFITLSILSYALLLERVTWPRLVACGLAIGAASVSKMSWPLMLPALGIMLLAALFRRTPRSSGAPADAATTPTAAATGRGRALKMIVASVSLAGFVWIAIWSAYGWQRTLIAPLPPNPTSDEVERNERTLEVVNYQWHYALHDANDVPRRGLVAALCRAAVDYSLLPDSYVFGLARTLFFTGARTAYFLGECSEHGWRGFFPLVFLIKTPLASLLLMFAGIAAVWCTRARAGDALLFTGAAAFIVIYGGYLIASNVNLGHRHLLPLYPLLYAIAGGAAAWLSTRLGRILVAAAATWLVAANLWIHPHYLSYFNELIGGPARGHEYVVDSSLDWGQDLVRLGQYARAHDEPVYLAYFGCAEPQRYLQFSALPSFVDIGEVANPGPGLYVISATQLVGLYTEHIRATFWNERALATLRMLETVAESPPVETEPTVAAARREQVIAELPEWRARLLISRLRDRKPEDRIGWSMFVYRLDADEVQRLTRP